jgi:sulfur relay (sulfurtransferase) DsrC/TusE family protein
MRSSRVIPADAQDHFWSVVKRCIREFHAEAFPSVLSKVNRLRKKVEQLPLKEMELFFHSEPFDVACRLAGHPLKVEDHLQRYLRIRDDDEDQSKREAKRGRAG